MKLFLTAIYR